MGSTKSLSELIRDITLYPQVLKNIEIIRKPPLEEVESIQTAIKNAQKEFADSGRVLLRYSGTETLIRVMAEGQDKNLVEKIVTQLSEIVKKELC